MSIDNLPYERYSRQLLLPGFGEAGQLKLANASVIVIGAGGLGCAAMQYLVAAGIGRLGIVDDDVVTLSNLQRQVLYSEHDLGQRKADVAEEALRLINSEVVIESYSDRLTTQNALEILAGYDLVIDATDNFPSRYLINDACVLLKKPLLFGAVSRFEGQLAIFNAIRQNEEPVNYRDLFPAPPKEGEVLNCAEAGVLGVLPGIIGTMQANEAIKLIAGIGEPLVNRLFTYNALTNQTYEMIIVPGERSKQEIPGTEAAFREKDYPGFCGVTGVQMLLSPEDLDRLVSEKNIALIDVREKGEKPALTIPHHQFPLSSIGDSLPDIDSDTWVFICQTGKRSLQAASYFSGWPQMSKRLYSLEGGILAWESFINKKEHERAHT